MQSLDENNVYFYQNLNKILMLLQLVNFLSVIKLSSDKRFKYLQSIRILLTILLFFLEVYHFAHCKGSKSYKKKYNFRIKSGMC
jgi:fatty-acid desaturase